MREIVIPATGKEVILYRYPLQIDVNLYRGPRPVSDADWKALQALGITTLISLEGGLLEGGEQEFYNEALTGKSYGIRAFYMPLSAVLPPTFAELMAVSDQIIYQLSLDQRVYVHCLKGEDRTGEVCCVHDVRVIGIDPADAINDMFTLGFHRLPYFYWLPSFEASLERFRTMYRSK